MAENYCKPLRVFDYAYLVDFIQHKLVFYYLPDKGKQDSNKEYVKRKADTIVLEAPETVEFLSNLLKISVDLLAQAYGVSENKKQACYDFLMSELQHDICNKPTDGADKLLQELKTNFHTEECLDEQDYNFVLGSGCLKAVILICLPFPLSKKANAAQQTKDIDIEEIFSKAIKILSIDGLDPKDRFPISIETQCFLDIGYMNKRKILAKKLGNEEAACIHELSLKSIKLDDNPIRVRTRLYACLEKYRFLFCSDLQKNKHILPNVLIELLNLGTICKKIGDKEYFNDVLFLLEILLYQTLYALTPTVWFPKRVLLYFLNKYVNSCIRKALKKKEYAVALATSPLFFTLVYTEHKLLPTLAEYRSMYIK